MNNPIIGGRLKANALRTLFRAARALQKRKITERDEHAHPYGSDSHWNESYYFNFFVPEKGFGGFTRIGMLPNQQKAIGGLILYLEDGSLRLFRNEPEVEGNPDEIRTGELVYERLKPLRKWRLRFSGNIMRIAKPEELLHPERIDMESLSFDRMELDLVWEGFNPIFDYKDLDLGAFARMVVERNVPLRELRRISRVASAHYEQAGNVSGRWVLDGRETEFVGIGHRDHSWGARDWKAPDAWRWLSIPFGPDRALNASRVNMGAVEVTGGFVWRDGRNRPIRRLDLETEFEADGIAHRSLSMIVEDTDGEKMEITGKVILRAPIIIEDQGHRTLIYEAMTRYQWKDRTTIGISEYLHQLGRWEVPKVS